MAIVALQRLARREREQLDEVARAARAGVHRQRRSVRGDGEAAEQVDLEQLHRPSLKARRAPFRDGSGSRRSRAI
jgi:hypothetical protein